MVAKKVVIAGGTGFVGSFLLDKFKKDGYEVVLISRQKGHVNWNQPQQILAALEDAELLINLAGKSINCRFTPANKEGILSSRIETTQLLGETILKCQTPPELWINASAIGLYRHSTDKAMSEAEYQTDNSFISEVVQKWENAFFSVKPSKTRQVALRISVVLGKNGGAFSTLSSLVRFGLGGKQASGKQMFSWIHIHDFYRIIEHLQTNRNLDGVFNCATANPVTNSQLMKAFRKTMQMPLGLPAPEFGIKLGAFFIGTEPELILKSQWVMPQRLIESGFNFDFPQIETALSNLLIA